MDSAMKVTMFGVHPSCIGGVSTLARVLIRELSTDPELDFEYIPTATQGPTVLKMLTFARALVAARRRLSKSAGVVHIHMADGMSVQRARMVMRLAKRLGQAIVLHIHCDLAVIRDASDESMRDEIDGALLAADHIVVLGTYLRPLLEELGVSDARSTVLPNAISCPPTNPYTPDRSRILFLGNVSAEKGILDLLEAIAKIDGSLDRRYEVDVCGRDLIGIDDEIAKRCMQDRVKYLGVVSPDQEFFSRYLLNVLPSHKEAMPFSLLESSAAGIPSIATPVGSVSELIDGPDKGYLVSPGDTQQLADALISAISSSSTLRDMSNAIFARVRSGYSLDGYLANIKSIYRSCAGSVR